MISVLTDPDKISSFMNIRVADIQACYELWKSRGAEFITEPKDKYGETRCYIRDPDGYRSAPAAQYLVRAADASADASVNDVMHHLVCYLTSLQLGFLFGRI